MSYSFEYGLDETLSKDWPLSYSSDRIWRRSWSLLYGLDKSLWKSSLCNQAYTQSRMLMS